MLFWIFVILFVVGGVCFVIGSNNMLTNWGDLLMFFSGVISFFAAIAVAISLVSFAIDYTDLDGTIASKQAEYEILVWQYENDIYDNDNDIGKKELMNDIRDWNINISRLKECQDNFWIGIYYPDIYDQFELIELSWY